MVHHVTAQALQVCRSIRALSLHQPSCMQGLKRFWEDAAAGVLRRMGQGCRAVPGTIQLRSPFSTCS